MQTDQAKRAVRITTEAGRAARHMVKARARFYANRPLALDMLHPGLAFASPPTLIAVATQLVERESRSPRRWFGFGGEVGLVNARAALLLGRTMRRGAVASGS